MFEFQFEKNQRTYSTGPQTENDAIQILRELDGSTTAVGVSNLDPDQIVQYIKHNKISKCYVSSSKLAQSNYFKG